MKNERIKDFVIPQDATVVEAMKKIDINAKGILFVTDPGGRLTGVITDGDIRRWLIRTGDLQGMVHKIMNANPKAVFCKEADKAKELINIYSITAVPILTTGHFISDIVFKEQPVEVEENSKKALEKVPVVIMAGGKGTRLYPYTKILPKPLIPIGDIPIMERIMNAFCEYGVGEFFATVNYKKEMIKSYFSDMETAYRIHYVEEDEPLGTAGSLQLMKAGFTAPFIVTNCDILIRADYADIYQYHLRMGNELTIVTSLKNVVIPYGVIYSSENGRIESMEEKPQLSYFVNTGMYILNAELVNEIPKDTFFHMTDLADSLLKENRKVGMYPISEDSFLDMGEMEEMRRMEQKLNLNSEWPV